MKRLSERKLDVKQLQILSKKAQAKIKGGNSIVSICEGARRQE